jgi:hypothetical protein
VLVIIAAVVYAGADYEETADCEETGLGLEWPVLWNIAEEICELST